MPVIYGLISVELMKIAPRTPANSFIYQAGQIGGGLLFALVAVELRRPHKSVEDPQRSFAFSTTRATMHASSGALLLSGH